MDEALLKQLQPLRERIDAIDVEILGLLNERARTAQHVGEIKKDVNGPVLRPEREAQVIRRLQQHNPGPLPALAVSAIWTEVMSACRGLEKQGSVAYLGPQGTFSEHAAFSHFGQSVQGVPCASIDEVFRAVEAGRADFGMVPAENSTEGAVSRTLDLLLTTSVRIIGERAMPIRHHLLTSSGTLDGVTCVRAHPQALAQCQDWLTQNHPELAREAVASNAEAARQASLDPTIAAIAGEPAALQWQLQSVAADIQDDPHNRTRFYAIGRLETWPSGSDKTSMILAVPNRAGAVYQMLAPLAENGVSMTRFESRPARTAEWEYFFYVDIEGHQLVPQVATALATLKSQAAFFKVLGSYPAA